MKEWSRAHTLAVIPPPPSPPFRCGNHRLKQYSKRLYRPLLFRVGPWKMFLFWSIRMSLFTFFSTDLIIYENFLPAAAVFFICEKQKYMEMWVKITNSLIQAHDSYPSWMSTHILRLTILGSNFSTYVFWLITCDGWFVTHNFKTHDLWLIIFYSWLPSQNAQILPFWLTMFQFLDSDES